MVRKSCQRTLFNFGEIIEYYGYHHARKARRGAGGGHDSQRSRPEPQACE